MSVGHVCEPATDGSRFDERVWGRPVSEDGVGVTSLVQGEEVRKEETFRRTNPGVYLQ